MYIKTERLELKTICSAHLEALTELLTDATVSQMYMIPDFTSKEEAENLARRIMTLSEAPASNVAGIFLDDTLIGMLNETDRFDDSIEVGYAILPRFHGCGYATEALCGAIADFFNQGFQRVLAGAFEENVASLRVMEKSGMRKLERQDTVSYRGREHPCVYYCAIKGEYRVRLTKAQVQKNLDALPSQYKTGDVDRLIRRYGKEKADVSALRPHILREQQFHRIYYYVSLNQIKEVAERMAFIHENLLFSDWWHTDQVISYVADLDFSVALRYAKEYIQSNDPFIRRWGYVLFISRLCKGHAEEILPLMQDDDHYYVQMGQGWLIAELTVHEPETVYAWMEQNSLKYNINGKAIQKICDSFRIADEWKDKFKKLRPALRERR